MKKQYREIIAIFADGREVRYTTEIMWLLVTDPATRYIIDAETGEIVWQA